MSMKFTVGKPQGENYHATRNYNSCGCFYLDDN